MPVQCVSLKGCLDTQVFHTVLEVVADGLHVIIEDPYGDRISVQYRLPKSNEYHQVMTMPSLVMPQDMILPSWRMPQDSDNQRALKQPSMK